MLLAIVTAIAVAKRLPPKPVTPVVADGVRYSAEGDGREQYVVAAEISTARELWRVRVFHTETNSSVEEDVQWVFITNLRVIGKSLLVRDEKGRCYSVDLSTHRVRKTSCGAVFTQEDRPAQ